MKITNVFRGNGFLARVRGAFTRRASPATSMMQPATIPQGSAISQIDGARGSASPFAAPPHPSFPQPPGTQAQIHTPASAIGSSGTPIRRSAFRVQHPLPRVSARQQSPIPPQPPRANPRCSQPPRLNTISEGAAASGSRPRSQPMSAPPPPPRDSSLFHPRLAPLRLGTRPKTAAPQQPPEARLGAVLSHGANFVIHQDNSNAGCVMKVSRHGGNHGRTQLETECNNFNKYYGPGSANVVQLPSGHWCLHMKKIEGIHIGQTPTEDIRNNAAAFNQMMVRLYECGIVHKEAFWDNVIHNPRTGEFQPLNMKSPPTDKYRLSDAIMLRHFNMGQSLQLVMEIDNSKPSGAALSWAWGTQV